MHLSRRNLFRAGMAGAVVVGLEISVQPAHAAGTAPEVTRALSPNGWPIVESADSGLGVWSRPIPGTGFTLDVAIGDVETILVHVVRRFHYEIATLDPEEVVGFRPIKELSGPQRNHASGTAVAIRPDHYPLGARDGFLKYELLVIRDILADCEETVRWGGDFDRPIESHFQIDLRPDNPRIAAVAEKLRNAQRTPGQGAGVLWNVQDSGRRKAARAVEKRQS